AIERDRQERLQRFKGRALARWDRNGNGVLDEDEKRAMRASHESFMAQVNAAVQNSGQGADGAADAARQRELAEFDTNGDGHLDDSERAAAVAGLKQKWLQSLLDRLGDA